MTRTTFMAGLAAAALVLTVAGPMSPPVQAAPSPAAVPAATATHVLTVSGSGVAMYPAFTDTISRYAVTQTDDDQPITVTATTSDPAGIVLIDGRPVTAAYQLPASLTAPGDEISVIFQDSGGTEAYSLIVTPQGFPTIQVTKDTGTSPGFVALDLSQWNTSGTSNFDTVVDRYGVPVYVSSTAQTNLDLKRQPDGRYSRAVPTATPNRTGVQIEELNSAFQPTGTRYETAAGLVNTDGHDSIVGPDGTRWLIASEPNAITGLTDAVIQEIGPSGDVEFQWDSSALAEETVRQGGTHPGSEPNIAADYAHINSILLVDGGDNILASFRHLSAVIKIAVIAHDGYQPGDIVWQLGGRASSFSFVDDPYGGPCAQHAATQLASGDIMVFDDGSGGIEQNMCVNPSDPTGPTVGRTQSRVAVWHLDQAAGTATLVWSYQPAGMYAFFAGSAYALGDGNVLVGWAAATQALTTEVAPDGTAVWGLKAVPSGSGTYFSYRAQPLATVPDTIAPRITSGITGKSYAFRQHVSVSFACIDTGGSSLKSCTGGLANTKPLPTGAAGPHSFKVTAADHAGNITTKSLSYTVRKPIGRPDAQIQRAGSEHWVGVNVYGGYGGQEVHRTIKRKGAHTTAFVRVRNAGQTAEKFRLEGVGSHRGFTVAYFSHGANITRRIVAGTYRTARLDVRATASIRLVVTRTRSASAGRRSAVVVRAHSTVSSKADAVAVVVVAGR